MQNIAPFLWFDGKAEEAVRFYASVFPNACVGAIHATPEGSHLPPGGVLVAELEVFGQRIWAMNGGPGVEFNDAVSLMVECDTQEELDRTWEALLEGGGQPMACGWLRDRYGVRWQVTPRFLLDLYSSGTPEQAARVFGAMMQMVKLDGPTLQRAFDGG